MTATEFCKKHKVSISSIPVPLKESDPKHSFRYLVSVNYAGKAPQQFEYWKGSGHVGVRRLVQSTFCPGQNAEYEWVRLNQKELACWQRGYQFNGDYPKTRFAKPIPPQENEVLYCLAMDVQSVLNSPLWEDWANELGYNQDSIKDKKVFEACCETLLKLRNLFGSQILNELAYVEDE